MICRVRISKNSNILFILAADGAEAIFRRYNVITKVETPNPSPNSEIEMDSLPIVSPDGNWFMGFWPGPEGQGVISLTGSSSGEGNAGAQGIFIGWFKDSHHWAEVADKQALIHDVYAPDQTETIPIPRTSVLLSNVIKIQEPQNIRCLSKSLFLAHTDLMPDVDRLNGVAKVDLFAGRLGADAQHTKHYTYRAPNGYMIFDAVFSPDGRRVAWLLQSPTTRRVSLRVSRLNLSDMYELGTLEDQTVGEHGLDLANCYSLRWLPNGQRLSFLYQQTLWTIPISVPSSQH